jgi:hypothetical protein
VKIKIKAMTIQYDSDDPEYVERFRRLKRRIKAMDRGDLAALLLTAVEKLDDKRVGFKAEGR